jgi:hypothetical protein
MLKNKFTKNVMDFTLKKYGKLIENIGPGDWTLKNYLKNNSAFIIRHDVDRMPIQALKMAEVENKFGIKSSYYFRVRPKLFNEDLIDQIYKLGHEIGYHYEIMDKAKGNLSIAQKIFKTELAFFSRWKSDTVAMHGNPLTKYNNLDFWKHKSLETYNLLGEAYLSIDFNKVVYYTDTGRGWNKTISFKDKGNKHLHKICNTDHLIEIISKNEKFNYIMTHPCYWSDDGLSWTRIKVIECLKNIIKHLIILKQTERKE